jgi:hypothetical protein
MDKYFLLLLALLLLLTIISHSYYEKYPAAGYVRTNTMGKLLIFKTNFSFSFLSAGKNISYNVLQLYAVVCRLCVVGKLRIGAVRCLVLFKI